MLTLLKLNRDHILFVSIFLSFISGNSLLLLCNLIVITLFLTKGAHLYISSFVMLFFFLAMSSIFQGNLNVRGFLLSFLTFSSFVYIFIIRHKVYFSEDSNTKALVLSLIKFHVLLSILQLPIQIYQYAGNIGLGYGASTGDVAYGTIGHSGMLAYKAAISLISILYISNEYSKKTKYVCLSLVAVSLLLVGSNHTLFFLLLSYLLASVFPNNLKNFRVKRSSFFRGLFVLTFSAFTLIAYLSLFSDQANLIRSNISVVASNFENNARLTVLYSTINLMLDEFFVGIFGLGIGGFNSRAAFMLSGTYLWEGVNPLIGFHMSPYFKEILYPLWNLEVRSNPYISGTYFQPFSFYLTVLAELGIFAFFLLISFIIKCVYQSLKFSNLHITALIIFFVLMCGIQNLPEFPNVAIPALLLISYSYFNSKKSKGS